MLRKGAWQSVPGRVGHQVRGRVHEWSLLVAAPALDRAADLGEDPEPARRMVNDVTVFQG